MSAPVIDLQTVRLKGLPSIGGLERERALTFAQLALAVFLAVERQVDLPTPKLPTLDVPREPTVADAARLARQARLQLGLPTGPVPNMVRLLEAHGVAVVRLDRDDVLWMDAFSHHGHRPIVLLNPARQDKARSRFDAARELGRLLMQPGDAPGSRWIEHAERAEHPEQHAEAFAAEFLAPATEIADDLPRRLDWVALHHLKRRWGISLKALIVRAHLLGRLTDGSYQRGLRQLAARGQPEAGDLGPLETPVLLPRALSVLGGAGALRGLALDAGLPLAAVRRVVRAAGADDEHPAVVLELNFQPNGCR
jgi:Zn-dependent peptidase ImmA (M78 family)